MHDMLQATATQKAPLTSGQDPMAIRWGINLAVRNKYIDADKVGFHQLPFAKFFPVMMFEIPETIHTVDDNPNLPMEKMTIKTAQSAQLYLEEMLAGKTWQGERDETKPDQGLRFGFFGDEDTAKMEVVSTTLLPTLPRIREIAQSLQMPCPIAHKCPSEDVTDFADRETCPTCWNEWLASDVCKAYIQHIATEGRDVAVTDIATNQTEIRRVIPALSELLTAHSLVTESLKRGLKMMQSTWAEISKEMEEGNRKGVDDHQNNIRKDVHADKPAEAQLRQVREYAKAVGTGTDNSVWLEALAKSQIQTNELLGKLVQQGTALPNLSADAYDLIAKAKREGDTAKANGDFRIGGYVLCDGQPGQIIATKPAGWFDVQLDDGSIQTVRKDKLKYQEGINAIS